MGCYLLPLDQHVYLNPKPIEIAKNQGAAGIIVVSNDTLSKYIDVDFRTLPNLPLFILSPEASAKLLKPIGLCSDIAKKIKENSISSQPLGINVCGKVAKLYNLIETQNVVAMLPGSDPKLANEYIVIGAHYDHLGMGEMGGSRAPDQLAIHNGADDNASGVVSMLEIAQKLASNRKRLNEALCLLLLAPKRKDSSALNDLLILR